MCDLLFILPCFLFEGPKKPHCTIQAELNLHLSNPPHILLALLPLLSPLCSFSYVSFLTLASRLHSSFDHSPPPPPPLFLTVLVFSNSPLSPLIHKAAYLVQPLYPISIFP